MHAFSMNNRFDKLVGYIEVTGEEDERELLSIADDGTVEGGEYYKGHELDPDMLFVIIRNAEQLRYKGMRLQSITVQYQHATDDGEDAIDVGIMEVWLYFKKEDK